MYGSWFPGDINIFVFGISLNKLFIYWIVDSLIYFCSYKSPAIKKYSILCCIINNDKVYPNIKDNTASRGRFLDYCLKLLIKQTIKALIKENKINANLPVKLIINIDEQTTKTNGYYNLRDGIFEELKYGISNYNYGKFHKPIVNSDLEVIVSYQKSEKSYLIQASDLIAGTARKLYLNNINDSLEFSKRTNFINYKLILP